MNMRATAMLPLKMKPVASYLSLLKPHIDCYLIASKIFTYNNWLVPPRPHPAYTLKIPFLFPLLPHPKMGRS